MTTFLQELEMACRKNCVNSPIYEFIKEETNGLLHKYFYKCTVLEHNETGFGPNKITAKREAAKLMLEYLKLTRPEFFPEIMEVDEATNEVQSPPSSITRLYEKAVKMNLTPIYTSSEGINPPFHCTVKLLSQICSGMGCSKKKAKEAASKDLLENFHLVEEEHAQSKCNEESMESVITS